MQTTVEAAPRGDRSKRSAAATRAVKRRSWRSILYFVLALALTLAWFVAFGVFNGTVFFVNLLLVCAVIFDPSRV